MSAVEPPSAEMLETFPNQYPGRDYSIEIVCPSRATRVTRAPAAEVKARGATAGAPDSIMFTASGIVGAA